MRSTQSAIISRPGSAFAAWMLTILLSAPWQAATAAPVASKQAAAAVAGWLSLDRTPLGETLGTSVQRVDTFSDEAGNALYYVVYLDPSGFVIVAADDLVEPIVGFARAGKFDPSASNPLGALVSKDLSARIAYARQVSAASPGPSALQAQAKWRQLGSEESGPAPQGPTPQLLASVSDVRIAPLTQSTWDQQTAGGAGTTACYNYYTPPGPDGNTANYPAGCVATATAQLIRYYQYPSVGVGSAGSTIYVNGTASTYYLHGGTGSGGAYVWGNMPLMPPATPATAQCQAIGALVADAGATVHMKYATNGSSASLLDATTALTSTFHYSSAVKGFNNSAEIGGGLIGMINPNLDARYPVLLGIVNSLHQGHAVVVDGYGYSASTLYHHMNLGWSGTASAWYDLHYIDTGLYNPFTVLDSCVYNAYTNGSGEIISGRVVDQKNRPVVGATVTATRSPSGTYTATTDSQGIYALARIPSASSYSITVTNANYNPATRSVSTGTSSDYNATSGNYWGADFTNNMLTTVIDHLVCGAVASTQYLSTPFPVTITAQNLTNGPATGFTGPVALSGYAAAVGSATTMIGNLSSGYYMHGSEMTLGYAFTPNTNVQVTAVRGYNTDKVSIWTDAGTLLTSQAVSASGSWVEAMLATPIALSAGVTYRVGSHLPAGMYGYYMVSGWPASFANGAIGQNFYYSYGDMVPLSVLSTGQGPLVDLRYQVVFTNTISVSPASSGTFVNGVWNGAVTVGQNATNVVLKADDGAGHTALSSPFSVVAGIRLLSPQRLSGGKFQCTVSSIPGLKIEILCSTNPVNPSSWITVTNLTNTTGTISFTDPTTSLARRTYRAHQLP